MSESLYEDLPEDEEAAFLILEQRFRTDRDKKTGAFDPDQYFPADHYLEYMRRTASAAQELGLSFYDQLTIPAIANLHWDSYRVFQSELEHYITSLQIRRSRRDSRYTVKLNTKTRSVISHHIAQIREIILRLEIDDWKREALLNCLNDLQSEVDRDRFRYQIWAAFTVEAAGVLGEAAERMAPLRTFIDSVSGLIWGNKHAEQVKTLPTPAPRRQIPPPSKPSEPEKPELRAGRLGGEMDDEIPF
jgi:hypothetical protein